MPWLRLDDKFAQHPKVADLSDRAFRVHVEVMLYCAEYATKGRIPKAALKLSTVSAKTTAELVAAGVWDRNDESLSVHDFLLYNSLTVDERVEAYLNRYPGTSANAVHRALGGKRELVLASVARFLNGSLPGSEGTVFPGTPGTAKPVPSRGRARTPAPTQEEPAEGASLSADRSELTANGLPFEKERVIAELLAAIGSHADEGTAQVVRSFAAQLPEGALAKVLESVGNAKPASRAAYAVAALKDEVESRQPVPARSSELRRDPELYVREVGFKMPAEVLEEVLGSLVPDEDERIRLVDLAADLRREVVA